MIFKLDPEIPSYSNLDCQFQILQLLEHRREPRLIIDLGTMFGAFAVGFALTFPSAKVLAIDYWQGEDSGLKGMLNSEENCRLFTNKHSNIELSRLDYTDPQGIAALPKNADLVYVGGTIFKNCSELLGHFSPQSLIAGVRYVSAECTPTVKYSANCTTDDSRVKLKSDLARAAKQIGRDLIPFGCHNWFMPAQSLQLGSST